MDALIQRLLMLLVGALLGACLGSLLAQSVYPFADVATWQLAGALLGFLSVFMLTKRLRAL